ncbi:MAG: acetyl-CoA carboxylase biotin carboxyl carrier protein subunit [Spirochaetaceae bacterium]|jgi:acetyl-CoA carboxylase biotin carboxyl carrier protein|nr:acetyl-CoA carboxylase biotin carboxyl carrier protein subunit [Spirochaetaceae bacterium]
MQAELITVILEKFSAGAAVELEFQDETCRLVLRKARENPASPPPPPGSFGPLNQAGKTPREQAGKPPREENPQASPEKSEIIASPIVATFYASAGPDSPPFVGPGASVKKGDPLCILEAMKMMNHLEAEFDCEILRVLGKTGEMVEFGQPLFEVKRLKYD